MNFRTWSSKTPLGAKAKLFCVRPPTFNIESWRLSVRKLWSIGLGTFELQVQRLCKRAKAKCFYVWHILNFWVLSSEAPTRAKCKCFYVQPPTFGAKNRNPNTFFCPWTFMHPSSNMFESSMRAQGIFCCLAFHITPKIYAWGLHERSITRFPYLTSNFQHQKFEVEQKQFRSPSHGAPKLHVWGLHKRPTTKLFCLTSNFQHQKLEAKQIFFASTFLENKSSQA